MTSKYGLSKMSDEDALLFLHTSVENGSEVSEAIADLKMIDSIFHMKDLHFATMANTQKTPTGRFRKNPHENTLNTIIDFLESKVLGTNINENNTDNLVSETESEEYEKNPSIYMQQLLECQKECVNMIKHIIDLQNLLRNNNIEFVDYFEKKQNLDK